MGNERRSQKVSTRRNQTPRLWFATRNQEEAKRIMQDKYFDCDVSREDAMPIHHAMGTQKFEMDP